MTNAVAEQTIKPHNLSGATLQAGHMVTRILDGHKTQLRIPFNDQPGTGVNILDHLSRSHIARFAPFQPGNIVWIRETWGYTPEVHDQPVKVIYKATEGDWRDNPFVRWLSPSVMPAEFARLFLVITEARAHRLQEITETDATAEGIYECNIAPVDQFIHAWSYQHNSDGLDWSVNPWVWAYTFKIHHVRQEVTIGN